MSNSEDRAIPVTLQLPTQEQRIEQDRGQKRKVRKFWRLRRRERKVQSGDSDEYLQPLDTSSLENDESDYNEPDQEEYKQEAYEQDKENQQKNEHYFVLLTLQSGHNLAVRDRSGTSDPYVKFHHNQFKYRSPVISRCLNPIWNKKFKFVATDLTTPVTVRVYDHDFGSSDDFMGGGFIDLTQYALNQSYQVKVHLKDPAAEEDDLGYILVQLELSTQHNNEEMSHTKESHQSIQHASHQLWKSTVTVTLLGAKGLPAMDSNGLSDPYCKFKLGTQKYKSKVQHKTLDPEWKEMFQMKLYDDISQELHIEVWDRDFPASDDYIGHNVLDLSQLEAEQTHKMSLSLQEAPGTLQLLVVKSGIKVMEDSGKTHLWEDVIPRYQLWRTVDLRYKKDVGFLEVQVLRADSLAKKGSSHQQLHPFASLEVGQCSLRTHTLFQTQSPVWDKTFYFNIIDVHDCLSVKILSEGRGKDVFLGRVSLPLLRLYNGQEHQYMLKDKAGLQKAHGSVTLKCRLVYNALRAAMTTINPREGPVLEQEVHVDRKVLMKNIKRCSELVKTILAAKELIESLFSWKDKVRSSVFLLVFTLACFFMDLWMVCLVPPLCLLFLYLANKSWKPCLGTPEAISVSSMDSEPYSDFSDVEELTHPSRPPKGNSATLRQRFRQMQDILLFIQTTTGYVADLSERAKNFFQWSVPFLCWMFIVLCLIASLILWLIQLRYIILFYGWFKSMKRLLRPHHIPTEEVLDFLSRAPTDTEMLEYHEPSLFDQHLLTKKNKLKKK